MNNDENVIVTSNPELVRPFSQQFEKLWAANERKACCTGKLVDNNSDHKISDWS